MKNQKLKRILSIGLVLAMTISASACTSAPAASEKTESTASTAGEESTEVKTEDGPMTPYAEPVKITWGVQTAAVQKFFDGDTYESNRWSKMIKEKLNIDVEVGFSADISTDAYKNKMNMLLASGELPDVVRFNDRVFFQQAIAAGYIADITDTFDKYASDAVKDYKTQYPDSFEGASSDGKLFGIPYMTDNFHNAAYLWIRDDWLKNTNSQPPKTVDEMVALAKKFTFEDPDKNGKDDTYGLGLGKSVVQSNFGTLLGLCGAYGIPGYTNAGIFYRGDDGKVTFPYIQPAMKDCLKLASQMYADGLIDPEFTVKDGAVLETDVASGKLGMMYHMNWGNWHPFNLTYQSDGVITRAYPIPTIDGIDAKMGIESNKIGDIFMVSSKCENPEATIKILNLFNNLVYESEDPEGFNKYWADEQYRLCPMYIGIPTELFAPQISEALTKGSGEGLPASIKQYYNYVAGFEDGSMTDPNSYGTWGQMNTKNGTMPIALDNYQKNNMLVTNIMETQRPEIWLQNQSVLGDMVDTTFTDIITGTKPLDAFDQFVKDWLAAGGQQTLDELETMYPAK